MQQFVESVWVDKERVYVRTREGMFAEAGLCQRTETEDSVVWE